MRKFIAAAALAASVLTTSLPLAAAARPYYGDGYEGYSQVDYRGDDRRYSDDRRGYRDDRRGYREDRRGYRDDRNYGRGDYNRRYGYDRREYRGQRCSGTNGTILGAIAGGLIGNGIAGRGDRTLGTVLGAGGGAVIGNSIDRKHC